MDEDTQRNRVAEGPGKAGDSQAASLSRRRALKVIAVGAAGAAALPATGCVPPEPVMLRSMPGAI